MGQSDWDHIMLKHRTHHQLIAVELETDNFRSVQVISNCQPCPAIIPFLHNGETQHSLL